MPVHSRDDHGAQPKATIRHEQGGDIERPPDVIGIGSLLAPLPEEASKARCDSIAEQEDRSRNRPPDCDTDDGAAWSAANLATGAERHRCNHLTPEPGSRAAGLVLFAEVADQRLIARSESVQ